MVLWGTKNGTVEPLFFINQKKIVRHNEDCRLAAVFVFVYCVLDFIWEQNQIYHP